MLCPKRTPSDLLTLLPENILLSAPSVFWVEIPNMWWLSKQGKNQVEFRQIDADRSTFETVTVSQEWRTPGAGNASAEGPSASPNTPLQKTSSKVKITHSFQFSLRVIHPQLTNFHVTSVLKYCQIEVAVLIKVSKDYPKEQERSSDSLEDQYGMLFLEGNSFYRLYWQMLNNAQLLPWTGIVIKNKIK